MKIQSIGIDFNKMAQIQNKNIMTVPLKENRLAKLLWNEKAVDCYITEKGRIVDGGGARGNQDYVADKLQEILNKLEGSKVEKFDIMQNMINTTFKK